MLSRSFMYNLLQESSKYYRALILLRESGSCLSGWRGLLANLFLCDCSWLDSGTQETVASCPPGERSPIQSFICRRVGQASESRSLIKSAIKISEMSFSAKRKKLKRSEQYYTMYCQAISCPTNLRKSTRRNSIS